MSVQLIAILTRILLSKLSSPVRIGGLEMIMTPMRDISPVNTETMPIDSPSTK